MANPNSSFSALLGQSMKPITEQCSGPKLGASLAISGAGALGYWMYLIVMGAALTLSSPFFILSRSKK